MIYSFDKSATIKNNDYQFRPMNYKFHNFYFVLARAALIAPGHVAQGILHSEIFF